MEGGDRYEDTTCDLRICVKGKFVKNIGNSSKGDGLFWDAVNRSFGLGYRDIREFGVFFDLVIA
jgi:hypothetical protein